jgi:putative phosphoribosyl transferase
MNDSDNESSFKAIQIQIPIYDDNVFLNGNLFIPSNTKGLVIFVHGSGSSGYSPRNQYLSQILNKSGISTVLIDLLTIEETDIDNTSKEYRFNIPLLSKRLISITDWLAQNNDTKLLQKGYFSASTGTAAALIATSQRSDVISTIVSRGGRPDLVNHKEIKKISCPILFIVGEKDPHIIKINKKALDSLKNASQKKIILIPGATPIFEEAGKMEQVARIASGWFIRYLLI